MDFFDTELDSIRAFNAETQSSIENLDSVQILPAQDVLFGLEAQQALLPRLEDMKARALKKVKDQELRDTMEAGLSNQLDQLFHGEPLKYPHAYLSLAQDDQVVTLLDYLGDEGLLVLSEFDKLQQQALHLVEEDQFWIEQETQKGLPDYLYYHKDIHKQNNQSNPTHRARKSPTSFSACSRHAPASPAWPSL